jgi:hypothetical protein
MSERMYQLGGGPSLPGPAAASPPSAGFTSGHPRATASFIYSRTITLITRGNPGGLEVFAKTFTRARGAHQLIRPGIRCRAAFGALGITREIFVGDPPLFRPRAGLARAEEPAAAPSRG